MSGNAKFRWFLLAPILVALLVVTSEAKELWVISGENSKNSKIWQEEVLNEYAKSELGKTIPAKIITVQGGIFPKWFLNVMQEGRVVDLLM